jgi:hypothetical protein
MRTENVFGLNEWARRQTRNAKKRDHCDVDGVWTKELLRLHRYILPEKGTEVEEYIQAEPWSGGPCYFFALRDTSTGEPIAESLWTDDEILSCTRTGRI